MYKLLIANKNYSSWSLRPWILMTELKIPFEEILIPFSGKGAFYDHSQDLPSRKVPALHHGNLKIWDSLAITEYLAERHSAVWPMDQNQRALARSAVCEMHSGFVHLRTLCSMNCGIRAKLKSLPPELQSDIDRISELVSGFKEAFGGPFLFGQKFTATDAFFAPISLRQQTYSLRFNKATDSYFETIRDLATVQSWYLTGINEPWTDASHDFDITKYAHITHDLRTRIPKVAL
ncbi:MAG: glutathione S-transferase family protein [Proteobacteria bacterium]|nr:glutathione S-transferase family protein [Pseudomonadota bacterium]